MIDGMICEGGLPGLPSRVTRLAGVTFCHPGSACVTRKHAPNANLNNMAARRYERGDFLAGFISPVWKGGMTQTKMKVLKKMPKESKLQVNPYGSLLQ